MSGDDIDRGQYRLPIEAVDPIDRDDDDYRRLWSLLTAPTDLRPAFLLAGADEPRKRRLAETLAVDLADERADGPPGQSAPFVHVLLSGRPDPDRLFGETTADGSGIVGPAGKAIAASQVGPVVLYLEAIDADSSAAESIAAALEPAPEVTIGSLTIPGRTDNLIVVATTGANEVGSAFRQVVASTFELDDSA